MIEIALVSGAHIHTPGFVKRLKARDDFSVKYVWDTDDARAAKNASALGSRVVPSLDDIWNDADIKAVIICSETFRHRELVLTAAAAGKHMFVEKPLGTQPEESFEMARAVERAGVVFQTGYFMRGNSANIYLKEKIAKGAFGKLVRIKASNAHAGAINGMFDTDWRWMADPRQSGVGGFGDLGSHILDITLWLLADSVPVRRVFASLGSVTSKYPDCDEYGEGIMEMDNGAIIALSAGWTDLANPVQLIVSGTEAYAYIANGSLFFMKRGGERAEVTNLPQTRPHAFEQFLNRLAGDESATLVTVREAAIRSAVMAAMYESARTGRAIAPQSS